MNRILMATLAAVICAAVFREPVPEIKQIGDMFIGLLKMTVIPIAFVSIVLAVITISNDGKNKVIKKAIPTMVAMSAAGVVIGFLSMSLFDITPMNVVGEAMEAKAPTVTEFIYGCIPVNPFASFANGNMLQIIVFAIFVGAASKAIPGLGIWKVFYTAQTVCMKMVKMVFFVAPVGVFCLIYNAICVNVSSVADVYIYSAVALILGSILYMAVVCAPVLLISGVPVIKFFKVVIVGDAVGSISGGATNYLGPRMATLKEDLGISEEGVDLLLPTLSVLMRAGSCICVGVYSVVVASMYGITLTPYDYAVITALSIIALTCAPGIIGGTLMDCAIIFSAVGLPLEAIGVLAGIDYTMDLIRTVLNVQGGEVVTASVSYKA